MAAQAGVSRLMFVMGRDAVLPPLFFGYIHPRWRTPDINILLVGAVALLALVLEAETVFGLISFGTMMAFSFVTLSIILQFWFREGQNNLLKDNVNYLLFPLMGALTA